LGVTAWVSHGDDILRDNITAIKQTKTGHCDTQLQVYNSGRGVLSAPRQPNYQAGVAVSVSKQPNPCLLVAKRPSIMSLTSYNPHCLDALVSGRR